MALHSDSFTTYNQWLLSQFNIKYYKVSFVCTAPSGNYFVACDTTGQLAVFSLQKYLSPDYWLSSVGIPKDPTSTFHFKAHYSPLHSLISTKDYLLS